MRRFLATILIDRSLDSGRTLPKWVAKLIENDPVTARYYADSKRLETVLRNEANDWAKSAPVSDRAISFNRDRARREEIDSSSRGRRYASMVGLAAGICLVALACWWGWESQRSDPVGDSPIQALHLVDQTVDLRPVIASLSAGQQVYDQVRGGAMTFVSRAISSTESLAMREQLNQADEARSNLRKASRDVSGAVRRLASTFFVLP